MLQVIHTDNLLKVCFLILKYRKSNKIYIFIFSIFAL